MTLKIGGLFCGNDGNLGAKVPWLQFLVEQAPKCVLGESVPVAIGASFIGETPCRQMCRCLIRQWTIV